MLIPTGHKQRLPRGFSYPLGAELLSEHLAGILELTARRVCFSARATYWASEFQQALADGSPYEIINAPAEPSGTVYVYAVQSHPRQHAQLALVSSGLPSLRAWLTEHFPPDPLRRAICRVMFVPPTTTVFLRERVGYHTRDLTA